MRKLNSFQETAETGRVVLDLGDGSVLDVVNTRDTGWRSLAVNTGSTGTIQVRRVGDRVTLRLVAVVPPTGSYTVHVATIPAGFGYTGQHYFVAAESGASIPSIYGMYSGSNLTWYRLVTNGTTRPTAGQYAEYTYITAETWPTVLPGTAI